MSLPFDLQHLLADLGVEGLQIRAGIALLGRGREHFGGALQQLEPPLSDLVHVNAVLLRQLNQRLFAAGRDQSHRRLEFRCMVPAGSFHRLCSSATMRH